ncbi:MAG: hypothetical protein AAGE96_10070 [Cyanobacteria bacterium P01_G01_bin.19]
MSRRIVKKIPHSDGSTTFIFDNGSRLHQAAIVDIYGEIDRQRGTNNRGLGAQFTTTRGNHPSANQIRRQRLEEDVRRRVPNELQISLPPDGGVIWSDDEQSVSEPVPSSRQRSSRQQVEQPRRNISQEQIRSQTIQRGRENRLVRGIENRGTTDNSLSRTTPDFLNERTPDSEQFQSSVLDVGEDFEVTYIPDVSLDGNNEIQSPQLRAISFDARAVFDIARQIFQMRNGIGLWVDVAYEYFLFWQRTLNNSSEYTRYVGFAMGFADALAAAAVEMPSPDVIRRGQRPSNYTPLATDRLDNLRGYFDHLTPTGESAYREGRRIARQLLQRNEEVTSQERPFYRSSALLYGLRQRFRNHAGSSISLRHGLRMGILEQSFPDALQPPTELIRGERNAPLTYEEMMAEANSTMASRLQPRGGSSRRRSRPSRARIRRNRRIARLRQNTNRTPRWTRFARLNWQRMNLPKITVFNHHWFRNVSNNLIQSNPEILFELRDRVARVRARIGISKLDFGVNVAAARIEVDGVPRIIHNINTRLENSLESHGIHSEIWLIKEIDTLRTRGRRVKIQAVLSERGPCGECNNHLDDLRTRARSDFGVFYFSDYTYRDYTGNVDRLQREYGVRE